jgi:hypothetical protein
MVTALELEHIALGATLIAYGALVWIVLNPQSWQSISPWQRNWGVVALTVAALLCFARVEGTFGSLSLIQIRNLAGSSLLAAIGALVWILVNYTGTER